MFDRVSKGRVAEVAGEGNGLGQVFIQAKGATKGTGEGSDFDSVGETGTDVIARAVEGKLGFIFERAKRGTVNDAFAIALNSGRKSWDCSGCLRPRLSLLFEA